MFYRSTTFKITSRKVWRYKRGLIRSGKSQRYRQYNENQVCLLIQDIKLLLYNCHQRVNRTIQSWKSLKVAILTQIFDSIEEDLELLCLITTRIFKYVWFLVLVAYIFPSLVKHSKVFKYIWENQYLPRVKHYVIC